VPSQGARRLRNGLSIGLGLLAGLAFWAPTGAHAATRYGTTPAVELDRCATAWVIRRHVEPQASFEFFAEGELPEGVVPFDLPEALLRRDARRAALEVLIERERISDPFVLWLGRMVHDAEIRAWARAADAPSLELERRVMTPVLAARDPTRALETCFAVLDALRDEESGR
jgi:hypothetical protein